MEKEEGSSSKSARERASRTASRTVRKGWSIYRMRTGFASRPPISPRAAMAAARTSPSCAIVGMPDCLPHPGKAERAEGFQGARPHLHLLVTVVQGLAQDLLHQAE